MDAKTDPGRMKKSLENWDGGTRIWSPVKAGYGAYCPKVVIGELVRVEEWDTEHGPALVAVIIDDTDAQETVIFLTSATLERQWAEQKPCAGDRIGVAFGGQDEAKSGRLFNRYKLMVERVTFGREPCMPLPPHGDPPSRDLFEL